MSYLLDVLAIIGGMCVTSSAVLALVFILGKPKLPTTPKPEQIYQGDWMDSQILEQYEREMEEWRLEQ